MTNHAHPPDDTPNDGVQDTPLEPWMLALARDAADELDASVEVPRDMMWARIQRARREEAPVVVSPRQRAVGLRYSRKIAAAAAVLIVGVAIGRYVVSTATTPRAAETGNAVALRDAAAAASTDPARVAMQEHLVRTVSLLVSVRDDAPTARHAVDLGPLAKELLATTRLLLDQPQLRDDRTRRLLQDLELVLLQIIQARSTAPETQNAPRETLRETNLLTRVNALVTASSHADAAISGED